jgi:hypothetical protein
MSMGRTRAAATRAATNEHTVTDERGVSVTRVYHPSADTWHDVDTESVADWHEQGWTAEPGEHNLVENYPALVDYSTDEPVVAVDGESDTPS